MKKIISYFLNGFLILAPLTLTVYFIVASIAWLNDIFDIGIPGLGVALIVALVTLTGFLGSSFLVKPFIVLMEKALVKVPVVSIIYSSIKDLFSAFVGDNQKFNKPVLVRVRPGEEVYKLGFLTQESIDKLAIGPGPAEEGLLATKVVVYLPHSYNISGEVFIVERDHVFPVDMPSSVAMKFIVSGGISSLT